MAKYRIEGTIVDTENASMVFSEETRFDGRNQISVNTGQQWEHQRLYRSRKGRYYLESWSQWQGSTPHAEWISPQEAARWLILNEHKIPDDLQEFEDDVSE
jgi:hypothetical protein